MKNWNFSKGGFQSMVLVKNLTFFHHLLAKKKKKKKKKKKNSQQSVFDDILERKKCFQTLLKIKKLKKSESQDFFKGVSPWFWSKI